LRVARRLGVFLAALLIAGCGASSGAPPIGVAALPDAESQLLAQLYAAALRSYGAPAQVITTDDPITALDTGTATVAPGFTGRLLARFDPDASARADAQVYRDLVAALPEGVAAGDYTTSADDKPAVAVSDATARAWGREVAALADHCADVRPGSVAGAVTPPVVGACTLPKPREFADAAALFAALGAGQVNAAWTSTAAPDIPTELVVLGDRTSLIRAENVVPLYRRNVLGESQVLAVNEIAGVLDTGSLVELRTKVAAGEDPAAVADAWLALHPLGR
jgi:glycine betaine/choline ABC-type transport system substrate-binding protein